MKNRHKEGTSPYSNCNSPFLGVNAGSSVNKRMKIWALPRGETQRKERKVKENS